MPSTNSLQSTLNWALPFLKFAPQTTGSLEPALTNANIIKQTILGPPFTWRQNRGVLTFSTIAGVQDYVSSVTDFGFLEKASVTDSNGNTFEIGEEEFLSLAAEIGRPADIAVQQDDNQNNLTFRLQPVPDQLYSVNLIYQRKPVPMTSTASLWSPLPDELGYVYNYGFLGLSLSYEGDARGVMFMQKFVGHLLGAQDGISDLARNIFLNNWLQVQSQVQRNQQMTQLGVTARTA